ncbi:hypothetical protein [Arenicella xantha]|uniref:Polyketide cyclase/dehydrase/lipid transport protein n=1 Tax=Arenicella xantha TaxID=644221 RepID=A0A395JLV7_9GAMM|nr:hypothetical protein [Arenicella xantha]RBP48770.1 hypothetical protein DFR28_105109 [Arenicella xantha]
MKQVLLIMVCVFSVSLHAKVVSSTPSHYVLQHQAQSTLSPDQLWLRLSQPSQWWHPDHTYSGDASNLSLDLEAGGLWREDWNGHSVLHGMVVNFQAPELLRLEAPFGPLQGMAVKTIWTITIKPHHNGSLVIFDEISNGSDASGLDELAKAVDYVKGEAISRLVAPSD